VRLRQNRHSGTRWRPGGLPCAQRSPRQHEAVSPDVRSVRKGLGARAAHARDWPGQNVSVPLSRSRFRLIAASAESSPQGMRHIALSLQAIHTPGPAVTIAAPLRFAVPARSQALGSLGDGLDHSWAPSLFAVDGAASDIDGAQFGVRWDPESWGRQRLSGGPALLLKASSSAGLCTQA